MSCGRKVVREIWQFGRDIQNSTKSRRIFVAQERINLD